MAVDSNLSKLAGQIEVERALVAAGIAIDSGVGLEGKEDTQTVSSNSDEHTVVYSTQDGEPHEILKIDARRVLTKRVNGRPAFWIPELGGEPPRRNVGEVRCYLDPEFDEKEQYDAIDREWIDKQGLRGRTCNMMAPDKNNQKFGSAFDRDDHMAKKHRREWATIQNALQRQRQDRYDREAQDTRKAMMTMAESITNQNAAQAPAKPAAK